ncbi:uncharacterized protein L3040_007454 [Drepanopeziza brunnea f. sp. 'multigermtubi']|uniref:Subtilase n=1 Tax=Marssonina brunnea f. sp. multigermtubi (strain MB_m1) TaxID=1072389 RepID=K1XCN0_MARBU|nr:subtilase [Drepanopeziza brunnea f. sp. 'multigermtubi' MB_m1]EKD18523.1 subtilase [Drepanopeziza brunnea f. sp. 'multigermtubi' MB_m1]KAJ5037277.1 hypothetical protein L3040_007454 [Drepanopeziza brunnea f. sp. 'multigermtubi']
MVAFSRSAAILAAARLLSTVAAENATNVNSTIIPGAYIVELAPSQDQDSFYSELEGSIGDTVTASRNLTFSLFKGVSFRTSTSDDTTSDSIAALPGVINIWPVKHFAAPAPIVEWTGRGLPLNKRADDVNSAYSPHIMSQVDRLHNEGIYGTGLKIAVIDTGVDYTHPALGGCFGPGCVVSYGYDFVGDNFTGDNTPVPDDDPRETCRGHGTHVAGIIAAQPNAGTPLGFTGVSPNVTLGAYRVFGCAGDATTSDVLIEATIRAYEDGSDIITASLGFPSGWAQDAWATTVSRIVAAGVPCTVAAGNEATKMGIFAASDASVGNGVFSLSSVGNTQQPTYNSDTQTVFSPDDPVNGGFLSYFSSWGPTWELEMKPSFGAPGGNILSTYPGGSYAVLSGTSMSTPFTAGVLALIAQVRGIETLRNPQLLEILLSSTSNANMHHNSLRGTNFPWLASVAQQGAGLIQAHNAAYLTTILDTSNIALNDSDNFVSEKTITITNTGNEAATYSFGHRSAISIFALYANSIFRESYMAETVEAFASLTFSPPSLSIPAGQKQSVSISFTAPDTGAPARLPVYSGFITINGTQGENLAVPYLGVAGSMLAATVMNPAQMDFFSVVNGDTIYEVLKADVTFVLPVPPEGTPTLAPNLTNALEPGRLPAPVVILILGSPLLRVEIVPIGACADCEVHDVLGLRSIGNTAGMPTTYNSPTGLTTSWDGQLDSGAYAPAGRYKIVVMALHIFGDATNAEHYDTWESPEFNIVYQD